MSRGRARPAPGATGRRPAPEQPAPARLDALPDGGAYLPPHRSLREAARAERR